MSDFKKLQTDLMALLLGDDPDASLAWAKEVLGGEIGVIDFFNQVFTPAMAAVGSKFGRLEIFLPELMDAADRAQAISDQVVQPLLNSLGVHSKCHPGEDRPGFRQRRSPRYRQKHGRADAAGQWF